MRVFVFILVGIFVLLYILGVFVFVVFVVRSVEVLVVGL